MSFVSLLIFVYILSYNEVACKQSFKTKYGDIYDCIDFYKQISFNHPMLKQHNFHPLMRPSFLAKRSKKYSATGMNKPKSEGCSVGTVPIKRTTKPILQIKSPLDVDGPSGTYVAGVRTQLEPTRYGGGSMEVSVYNPPFVKPSAYSQARLQVSNGDDVIQVGWRVDPSLRGDNRTRLFIYTDAGQSHCFDADCGFILLEPKTPLDKVLEPVSQPGGTIYVITFNITRDPLNGNWWFLSDEDVIGFWPKRIFTGLGDLATNIEWAGEVFSPPGVPEPIMGSGYRPNVGTTRYVAFFYNMKIVNTSYTSIDVENLEEIATNRALYDVRDEGNVGRGLNRLAFFGGARF